MACRIKKIMKKLERKKDGSIAGVCSGLANYFGLDEGLVKIVFAVLLFTPFPIFWTYIMDFNA